MNLSPVEMRIIKWIADGHPVGGSRLLAQVAHLRVAERQSTGKGFFVVFERVSKSRRCDGLKDVVSAVISTNLPAPRDVVGFSLFINDGAITSFEGYTYGSESWPAASMEDWLALKELTATEHKAK